MLLAGESLPDTGPCLGAFVHISYQTLPFVDNHLCGPIDFLKSKGRRGYRRRSLPGEMEALCAGKRIFTLGHFYITLNLEVG
jgi:hypothetical protein